MADTMRSMHVPERREYARLLLGKDVLYLLPRHCCTPSKGPYLPMLAFQSIKALLRTRKAASSFAGSAGT